MKKKLLSILIAIVAITSCNTQDDTKQDNSPVNTSETTEVTFNVGTGTPLTRAEGNVTRYVLEVYEDYGYGDTPAEHVEHIEQDNGIFKVTLENDTEYVCLFWADNGDYNVEDLRSVQTPKEVTGAPKEVTEAFFYGVAINSFTETNQSIVLRRAVAQLNIIETGTVLANTDMQVTFDRYTMFDVLNAQVGGMPSSQTTTFNSTATTGTLGTLLTLASVNGIIADIEIAFGSKPPKTATNTPLTANYITNIRAEFAPTETTKDFTFTVSTDNNWDEYGDLVQEAVIDFPDAEFKTYLVKNFDLNGDNNISIPEALLITEIDCAGSIDNRGSIESLKGIEMLPNLDTLICHDNKIQKLDVSQNSSLSFLACETNLLSTIDVSYNKELVTLGCGSNRLKELYIAENTMLEVLGCEDNNLTEIDLSFNTQLNTLYCYENEFTILDVTKNKLLTTVECSPMATMTELRVLSGVDITSWSYPAGITISEEI